MAPSSKKSRSGSRRTSSGNNAKRNSRKRTTSTRKKQQKKGGRIKVIALVLSLMVLMLAVGYCLGSCWRGKETATSSVSPSHKVKEKKTQSRPAYKSKPVVQKKQTTKPRAVPSSAATTYATHTKLAYRGERPKLVIIIDDVHTPKQLEAIQSLPVPVTPSIFPPYRLSPYTPRLATHAVHYMIHLPMESGSAKFNRQSKTLMRSFTQAQIAQRIRELRRLFPRAHYINNHTGSRFTADESAMMKFYRAMKDEGFAFIDSRTTAKSKVKQVAHRFGDDYVARDIFLDNVKSVSYIHGQLKKAVRLAKKNGYAIAIGHPHHMTMEALRRAKPLLKEVEVVYIDEIFREN